MQEALDLKCDSESNYRKPEHNPLIFERLTHTQMLGKLEVWRRTRRDSEKGTANTWSLFGALT